MSIFDELASEAANLESAPSDEQIALLRDKCVEMAEADAEVARLERELESAKEKKNTLAHKEIPDLFAQMGIDRFGLPDVGEFGADIILSPYFKASIPADWPDDKKKEAFDHLEEIGGGDLIKVEVKFLLGKGESELARRIAEWVSERAEASGLRVAEPSIGQGVPWNSLTSFVKERYGRERSDEFIAAVQQSEEEGIPVPVSMDVTKLNATIGQVVKVKERKK